jgi:peptide/nickel transport system substrate-binding protein
MATRTPPRSKLFTAVLLAVMASSVVLVAAPTPLQAAETPRRGGVLLAVIGADPPSLDPHQESTFANIQLVAPLYSTLIQIDPYNFPKIIGDVATEWKVTPDGLTYTFKIRQGIRFHDGSPLTAADVKATYDKIVSPPEGVRSVRKNAYTAVARIETPDPSTVVFKLKFPSASLLDNLASPWNVIFPKKYLDKDPNHFKTNVVGSGPFKLKSYTRGSTFEGERNRDYFVKDRPYLDGYKFFISPETSVRAAAIRSGRAYIEFRDLPSAEVDAIRKQLGDKVAVQTTAVDRPVGDRDQQHGEAVQRRPRPQGPHAGLRSLHGRQGAADAHRPEGRRGLMRPGSEWAMPEAELQKLPGFGKDAEKNRPRPAAPDRSRLPQRLKVVVKNRNVKLPTRTSPSS